MIKLGVRTREWRGPNWDHTVFHQVYSSSLASKHFFHLDINQTAKKGWCKQAKKMRTPPYLKRINGWDDKDHHHHDSSSSSSTTTTTTPTTTTRDDHKEKQEHEEEQQAEQQEEEKKKTKKRQQKSNDNKNWTTLNHVLISGTLPNYITWVGSFEE